MAYLEELLPEFRKGTKIRINSWAKDEYIYLGKNWLIYDERDKPFGLTNEELFANWELYQEPIDWDYIIKNKCLCWFWDNEEKYAKEYGFLGFLTHVQASNYTDRFEDLEGKIWRNCRPVLRDEVIFYEDREDE